MYPFPVAVVTTTNQRLKINHSLSCSQLWSSEAWNGRGGVFGLMLAVASLLRGQSGVLSTAGFTGPQHSLRDLDVGVGWVGWEPFLSVTEGTLDSFTSTPPSPSHLSLPWHHPHTTPFHLPPISCPPPSSLFLPLCHTSFLKRPGSFGYISTSDGACRWLTRAPCWNASLGHFREGQDVCWGQLTSASWSITTTTIWCLVPVAWAAIRALKPLCQLTGIFLYENYF